VGQIGSRRVAVAVTFCVSGTPPAFAAADSIAASRDQIEARRQALLQLMLQDPSNLDVAFEYASLSSQVGDYEAAVSTLTRRPDLEQAGARFLGLVGWKGRGSPSIRAGLRVRSLSR
jgi:hypothetical protein